jgi:hypothetical protein
MTKNGHAQEHTDDQYVLEMSRYFKLLSLDELATLLADETTQAELMDVAKLVPELMERVLDACELLPHGMSPEEEAQLQHESEISAQQLLAHRKRAFGESSPELPLNLPLAIVCSWRPLTPVWQGGLGETDQAEETRGNLIRGGEIALNDYFENNILAEQIPWAGPVLRIVSQTESGRDAWVASVSRRLSTVKKGTLRIRLKDAGGQRSEVCLTFEYPTAQFPEQLAPHWVAYLSIE